MIIMFRMKPSRDIYVYHFLVAPVGSTSGIGNGNPLALSSAFDNVVENTMIMEYLLALMLMRV